jgi:hypothetical protein
VSEDIRELNKDRAEIFACIPQLWLEFGIIMIAAETLSHTEPKRQECNGQNIVLKLRALLKRWSD